MNISNKLTKIVASAPEPLTAYQIALAYWENEQYHFAPEDRERFAPKEEDYEKQDRSVLSARDVGRNKKHVTVVSKAKARGARLDRKEAGG